MIMTDISVCMCGMWDSRINTSTHKQNTSTSSHVKLILEFYDTVPYTDTIFIALQFYLTIIILRPSHSDIIITYYIHTSTFCH
jgi:hypothetical protein